MNIGPEDAYARTVKNASSGEATKAVADKLRQSSGTLALAAAIADADQPALAGLVNAGVDVNAFLPDGRTPLMLAAGLGQPLAVELLLAAGADPCATDRRAGTTALHKAALAGNPDVAALILDHGAFIDQQVPILGHTALMDAVVYKQVAVVRLLLQRGARTSIRNHWDERALDLARRDGLEAIARLIEERDTADAARTAVQPLVLAIMTGDLSGVRDLIAEGSDVNARLPMVGKPDDDYTPLAIAAREGHAEIVGALLEAGADPRRVIGLFRGTALHEAAYFGHSETVRAMTAPRDPAVGPAADLAPQGALNGMTPLHDAVWHGHAETALALIEAGHPLNLVTHAGLTARMLAVRYGYDDLARDLADAEARKAAAGS